MRYDTRFAMMLCGIKTERRRAHTLHTAHCVKQQQQQQQRRYSIRTETETQTDRINELGACVRPKERRSESRKEKERSNADCILYT